MHHGQVRSIPRRQTRLNTKKNIPRKHNTLIARKPKQKNPRYSKKHKVYHLFITKLANQGLKGTSLTQKILYLKVYYIYFSY